MVAAPTRKTSAAPTVLLTGFEPFGGAVVNPSWLAVQALHGRRIAGHRVVTARLPTAFGAAPQRLQDLLQAHQPALTICVGQAGGRAALSLERVAINLNDARIQDNAGAQPIDTPVVPGGPAAYFTTLPIKAILVALQKKGLAVEVSQTAGTFVCNQVFYSLMHALATQPALAGTRGGFVHVPWLPEQGSPAMALQGMVDGLHLAIRVALSTRQDLRHGAGQVS